MFTKISLHWVQHALQLAAVLMAIGLPLGLFIGGAQPVAVELFPAPYDKLAHATVFALLASAMGYASGLRGKAMVMVAMGGAAAVGGLDEWHQMYLPGRSAGWDDLVADAAGATLGAVALVLRERFKVWLLQHFS